jgi:hypothetical protein
MKQVEALYLAKRVNTAMINQQSERWVRYLEKYVISDIILTDLLDNEKKNWIMNCLLKQLSREEYFVRPGQHLGTEKFSSATHHTVYRPWHGAAACLACLHGVYPYDISPLHKAPLNIPVLMLKQKLAKHNKSGDMYWSLMHSRRLQCNVHKSNT